VSEGAEIEKDSPPSLEGVVVEPLLVPNRVATKEEVAERESGGDSSIERSPGGGNLLTE
jgi:hypothetical protein